MLLFSFDAPGQSPNPGCVEVEVPDEIAGARRSDLAAGVDLLMAGALVAPGVLLATFIHPSTNE